MFFRNRNIIYSTGTEYAKYLFGKFALIVTIGAGLAHFNENPVVISIMVIVCAGIVLFFYEEELIVFTDKFVFKPGFSLPLSDGKQYYYKDVKKVVYPVEYELEKLPKKLAYRNDLHPWGKIHIIFRNGEEELLHITIKRDDLLFNAIGKINEQLGN